MSKPFGEAVKISTPLSVTPTECSNWAESDLSLVTAVQPSGTLSLLPGVTPGIHGAYAPYYIRRVRFGATDPLVEVCRAKGYPVMYDVGLDGRVVGIDRFGLSAPAPVVFKELGLTVEAVVAAAQAL